MGALVGALLWGLSLPPSRSNLADLASNLLIEGVIREDINIDVVVIDLGDRLA